MPKYVLVCLLLALSISTTAQWRHGTGVKLDDSAYSKHIKIPNLGEQFVFSGPHPVISFRSFTPYPVDQGTCETCIGYACAYSALTTMWAIQKGTKDKKEITENAFDPLYLYYSIADSCKQGSEITDAMNLIRDKGVVRTKDLAGPVSGKVTVAADKLTKVLYYDKLFELHCSDDGIIDAVTSSLYASHPVVIVGNIDERLADLKKPDIIWVPDSTAKVRAAHAMCVIGCDDKKKLFEIMNSWGANWGDDGYFFISYHDFARMVRYAYLMLPNIKYRSINLTDIVGDFEVDNKKAGSTEFKEVKPQVRNNQFIIDSGIKAGDTYRFQMINQKDNMYAYLIGLGPDNKVKVLYPAPKATAASQKAMLDAAGNNLMIDPSLNMYGSADARAKKGTYQYCIMYSHFFIDAGQVVQQMNQKAGRHNLSEITDILGSRLNPTATIDLEKGEISGQSVSASGDVICLNFKISVSQ